MPAAAEKWGPVKQKANSDKALRERAALGMESASEKRQRFEALKFEDLLKTPDGVDYFLKHHDRYTGLSSEQASYFLNTVPFETVSEFFKVINSFGYLDNEVAIHIACCFGVAQLVDFQKRFLPLERTSFHYILEHQLLDEKDFEGLMGILKLPYPIDEISYLLKRGWFVLIAKFGQRLVGGFSDYDLIQMAIQNDCFDNYVNCLIYQGKSAEPLPMDPEEILTQLVDENKINSVKDCFQYCYHRGWFLSSDIKLKIIVFANERSDTQLVYDIISTWTDGWGALALKLLEMDQNGGLFNRYGIRLSNLGLSVATKMLNMGLGDLLLRYRNAFSRRDWNEEFLMRLVTEKRQGRITTINFPNFIISYTGGSQALADAMIDVGWGGVVLAEQPALGEVEISGKEMDRMLKYHSDQVRADRIKSSTQNSGADNGDRPPERNNHEAQDYLESIAENLGHYKNVLTAAQAEVFWNNRCIKELLDYPRVIPQKFITTEKARSLLATDYGRCNLLDHIDYIKGLNVLDFDNRLFHELISTPNNVASVWNERHHFSGVVYDEDVIFGLLFADMKKEFVSLIDQAEPFKDITVYQQIFDRCMYFGPGAIERLVRMVRRHSPAFESDIIGEMQMFVGARRSDNSDIDEWCESLKENSQITFPDTENGKKYFVLSSLLSVNAFEEVEAWLKAFSQKERYPALTDFFNNRLVALASNLEWYNVTKLLEVMDKHGIEIDLEALLDNNHLLEWLSRTGSLVSDPAEERQLRFLQGMRSEHPAIRARLLQIAQNNPKEILVVSLLRQVAAKEAVKETYRREHRELQPVYYGPPLAIVDEAALFYVRETVQKTMDRLNDTLADHGQELTPAVRIRIAERTGHAKFLDWLKLYLVAIIDGELEYAITSCQDVKIFDHEAYVKSPGYTYDHGDPDQQLIEEAQSERLPDYMTTIRTFLKNSTFQEIISYLDRAEAVYCCGTDWVSGSFGGKSWGNITKWTRNLFIAVEQGDDHAIRHAIDTIFSLHHNSGSLFNKTDTGMLDASMPRYLDVFKDLQDLKQKSANLLMDWASLTKHVGSETKTEIVHVIQSLYDVPGYDYANQRIKTDVDWRRMRGVKPQGD